MRLVRPICGVLALALACAAGLLLARSVGGATGGPTAPTLILPTTRLGPALTLPFRPPPIFTRPRPGVFVLPQPVGQVVPGFPVAVGEVLFVSSRDGAPEIYQMHATGAGQTRLTSAFGTVADPTLSIDGRLTYSSVVDGHWEIVVGDADTPPQPLTHDTSRDREPHWLGRTTLLYVSNRSGNDDIWQLTLGGGPAVDLTAASTGADLDPAPSPDGKRIAFASNHGSGFDLYVLVPAANSVVQLTHDGAGNRHPTWSPDGSTIAFDRAGPGGSDIWTIRADGSAAPQPAIATAADEFAPSYAPAPLAGKARFAYVTNANGNYEIWAANDDGSNAFDLSQSPAADDLSPFWAPAPQGLSVRLSLQPSEVEGAGGGPNKKVDCTVSYTGTEPIRGTKHDDVICGSNHADTIIGGDGNDVIYPRKGADVVRAGGGDDLVYVRGGGTDTVDGGGGFDEAYVDQNDVSDPSLEQLQP